VQVDVDFSGRYAEIRYRMAAIHKHGGTVVGPGGQIDGLEAADRDVFAFNNINVRARGISFSRS
jgi:hypothetical protein